MTKWQESTLSGWGLYPEISTHISSFRGQLPNTNLAFIARGLGRSYADQAIAENGLTLLTQHFDKVQEFDIDTGFFKCQSGLSLATIIDLVAPFGWFPKICPGTKFVSIGGAIANDIHGKGHHITGSFESCIISMDLKLANGDCLKLSRTENSEIYWATIGGLGLTGIILSVEMQLQKIESTWFNQRAEKFKNLQECFDLINKYDQAYNYSVGWINTTSKSNSGVLSFGNSATAEETQKAGVDRYLAAPNPKLNVPFRLPNFTLNKLSINLLNQVLNHIQSSKSSLVHFDPFFFPLDMATNWNRGYGTNGFIQYQFVLPEKTAYDGISGILHHVKKAGHVPFLNVIKKFGEGNSSLLSFPSPGYTLALDFKANRAIVDTLKTLNSRVCELGGKVYLAKDALLDRTSFSAMYPNKDSWLKIKKEIDPHNKINSAIATRIGLCN